MLERRAALGERGAERGGLCGGSGRRRAASLSVLAVDGRRIDSPCARAAAPRSTSFTILASDERRTIGRRTGSDGRRVVSIARGGGSGGSGGDAACSGGVSGVCAIISWISSTSASIADPPAPCMGDAMTEKDDVGEVGSPCGGGG